MFSPFNPNSLIVLIKITNIKAPISIRTSTLCSLILIRRWRFSLSDVIQTHFFVFLTRFPFNLQLSCIVSYFFFLPSSWALPSTTLNIVSIDKNEIFLFTNCIIRIFYFMLVFSILGTSWISSTSHHSSHFHKH